MRASGTPDLPGSDSVHVDELITWLSEEISQARYAIKKKVRRPTVFERVLTFPIFLPQIIENARSNVAEMAAELLSIAHARHVPHTLGLYMRLALLASSYCSPLIHHVNLYFQRRHLGLNHSANAF